VPKTQKNRKKIHKIFYSIIILFLVIIAIIYVDKKTSLFTNPKKSTISPVIKKLPTQTNPNKSKGPSSNNGIAQGTSTNVSGSTTPNTSSSTGQWTSSQSGNIILKEPLANSTLSTGALISGSSTTTSVDYTLIDNQAGVISQGSIPVINGNFSADMNFQNYSSNGRLDVFSTEANGKENNLIEIQVNF